MAKKKMSFEEAMIRLETIADQLEQGNIPLEDALKLYEEGAGLAAFCSTALKDAQQRITEIDTASEVNDND